MMRSITEPIDKALLKINPKIFKCKTKYYYNSIISKHSGEKFDYILIIKCDMPSIEDIKSLRSTFPNAKMCLHLWDSVKNNPHILEKINFFDRVTSFDRHDCETCHGFKFRPLFFADEFSMPVDIQYKYDISFCGTIHSDRYKILKEIKRQSEVLQINYYGFHYLQSKFIYYFYRMTKSEFRGTSINDFVLEKKSIKEIAEIVNESRVVVDIQHPKQTGLTMRTIEMVGMHKKMITTNTDIMNYDFYNPNNIFVIDRNNPIVNKNFLTIPYKDIPDYVYQKYTLVSWIFDVFGLNEN